MVQPVKLLPCKHENLSLDPQNPYKKPGVVPLVCNPRDGKVGGRKEDP